MGYIYGKKLSPPLTDLTRSLRSELYEETPYDSIVWKNMGNNVCPIDLYTPHTALVNFQHCKYKIITT